MHSFVLIHHILPCLYSSTYVLFSNHTPPTEIYTLSLHDALPIFEKRSRHAAVADAKEVAAAAVATATPADEPISTDRKSTRLNSSHRCISYAVFCLKKKKKYRK